MHNEKSKVANREGVYESIRPGETNINEGAIHLREFRVVGSCPWWDKKWLGRAVSKSGPGPPWEFKLQASSIEVNTALASLRAGVMWWL